MDIKKIILIALTFLPLYNAMAIKTSLIASADNDSVVLKEPLAHNYIAPYVDIYRWYSPIRKDNFTTTDQAWQGAVGDRKEPGYRLSRIEGMMFNPDNPQPSGTVPVFSWYSPSRGDNFMTSDPRWRGNPGDVRSPDYIFVRLEGYAYDPSAPPPNGSVPLYAWYDPDRGDNFAGTSREWAGFKGIGNKTPNYRYIRREGYVIPKYDLPGVAYNVVPLYFHFQYNHIDPNSGLPAYGRGENMETMDSIDKAVDRLNEVMDKSRGLDTRRLQFVRAGVRYEQVSEEYPLIPLFSWNSEGRNDYLTSAHSAWLIDSDDENQRNPPDYFPKRIEGSIFPPDQEQPEGTVPVYSWYSPSRGDNLISADPSWNGAEFDTKDPDYHLVRKEGYIYDPNLPQPLNSFALYSWYNREYGDNLSSTDSQWEGEVGDRKESGYEFVRLEGYLPGCDLIRSSISSHKLIGAINVLATNACEGVNTSPSTVVSTAGSLAHEVGHALGLFHLFEGNKDANTVELLYRNLDPNSDESCYRRGDKVCDTPPDYGFARADGDLTDVVCGSIVPVPCQQLGPSCDNQEPMFDGNGLCRQTSSNQGVRTYNAIELGLQKGTPNNIMAYHSQDEFSYEQYLRMLYYSLWRFGLKAEVPNEDKNTFNHFNFGPLPLEIWNSSPSEIRHLNKIKKDGPIPMSLNSTSNRNQWTTIVTQSVGNSLLDFKINIMGSGLPSDNMEIQVSLPSGRSFAILGEKLKKENGRIFFDEIYGQDLEELRNLQPYGRWTIRLLNNARFTPNQVFLTVLGY